MHNVCRHVTISPFAKSGVLLLQLPVHIILSLLIYPFFSFLLSTGAVGEETKELGQTYYASTSPHSMHCSHCVSFRWRTVKKYTRYLVFSHLFTVSS